MVMPLAGLFGGVSGSVALFLVRSCIALLFFKTLSFKFLAYYIPGLFAALYLAKPNALVRFFIPLVCMILFIAHPEGGRAWMYTLYWFIPMGVYFSTMRSNTFVKSLGSTFTAHAVGSVIWLYATNMGAAYWIGLIPVVAFERLLFASGTTVAYHCIVYLKETVRLPRFVYTVDHKGAA